MSSNIINAERNCAGYLLVWLDKHICDPKNSSALMDKFVNTVNPMYNIDMPNSVGDIIKLNAFTTIDKCLSFILEHKRRRIFFIVSGSLGEIIVPQIMDRCSEMFHNSQGNPTISIYCFCHNKICQDWACDYLEYIKVFNHEGNLLVRLCHDIVDQFMTDANEIMAQNTLYSTKDVLRYYNWAKILIVRVQQLNPFYVRNTKEVEPRIEKAERRLEQILESIEGESHECEGETSTIFQNISSTRIASNERTTYIMGIASEEMKKAEKCLDECLLVWLEPALDGRSSPLNVRLGLLSSIQRVQRFNDVEICLEYLRDNVEKRVFLVLSYQISDEQAESFHSLSHIDFIYAFSWEAIFKPEHSRLVKVTSIEELISRLSCDSHSSEEDNDTDFASLRNEVLNPSEEFQDDARVFIFYQLLLEVLLHHPKTADIKNQFISFGMQIYQDNPKQMEFFENLDEKYPPLSSSKAIPLYTSGSYSLHRVLNRACRMGNMKNMFKLVYFMTDLYGELKNLHKEYFDLFPDRIHVYRGRPMIQSEFEKLQSGINDLVVTKSFLSTTTDFKVARMYSGADSTDPHIIPAILKMIIDKQRNESKPFAFIQSVSKVKADREVLLSIGMVFRVIHSECKNGVQEFTLLRSDPEEQIEREMRNTYLGYSTHAETDSAFCALLSIAKTDPNLKKFGIEDLVHTVTSSDIKTQTADELIDPLTVKENERLKNGTVTFISLASHHK